MNYNKSFYTYRHNNTVYSAQTIGSLALDLVNPRSVVDVGCGVGTWLKVFKDLGVENILGIEGEWVSDEQIVIPKEKFS